MKKDIFVLTADLDTHKAVESLLKNRGNSFGIKSVSFEIKHLSTKDAGCYKTCHDYLRTVTKEFKNALVVFDYEGCGTDSGKTPEQLENEVEKRLAENGWEAENAFCIVIAPELEVWAWQNSPHVAKTMGWDNYDDLKSWLSSNPTPFEFINQKPTRPKEAMRAALRERQVQPSSAQFAALASRVTLTHCEDRAFKKLADILKRKFEMDG